MAIYVLWNAVYKYENKNVYFYVIREDEKVISEYIKFNVEINVVDKRFFFVFFWYLNLGVV